MWLPGSNPNWTERGFKTETVYTWLHFLPFHAYPTAFSRTEVFNSGGAWSQGSDPQNWVETCWSTLNHLGGESPGKEGGEWDNFFFLLHLVPPLLFCSESKWQRHTQRWGHPPPSQVASFSFLRAEQSNLQRKWQPPHLQVILLPLKAEQNHSQKWGKQVLAACEGGWRVGF